MCPPLLQMTQMQVHLQLSQVCASAEASLLGHAVACIFFPSVFISIVYLFLFFSNMLFSICGFGVSAMRINLCESSVSLSHVLSVIFKNDFFWCFCVFAKQLKSSVRFHRGHQKRSHIVGIIFTDVSSHVRAPSVKKSRAWKEGALQRPSVRDHRSEDP